MDSLHSASKSGYLSIVKYLSKLGANIESKSNLGWTPLISASGNGHLDIVKFLLEQGANIESRDNGGRTPLYCFIYRTFR